jgi:heme exporter protein B
VLKAMQCVIGRDLRLYFQHWGECLIPMLFLILVVSLFPMGLGSHPKLLARIAPAVIWIAVVLSLLMSLESVFRQDYQEGSLAQIVLSPYPLSILLLGKSIAHWIMVGLPLLILAPFLSILLQGSTEGLGVLGLTLIFGIPTLSLIGSIGAALTIGLPNGGVLLAVLVLPIMMPIVIFGTSAVTAATEGVAFYSELYILAALFILALALGPVALSNAVRASLA